LYVCEGNAMSSENQFKCEECGMVFSSQQELSSMLTRNMLEQHNPVLLNVEK
jgi:hypothetical protein